MTRLGISAIIPTHNRPEMLEHALGSIAGQSRPPDELIVVDDVGDPATRETVERFAATAPFAGRYVHNESRRGACGSRNLGASLALNRWLAFLDDDDIWRPRHLELLESRALRGDVDFVVGGFARRYEDEPERVRLCPEGLTATTLFTEQGAMTGSNFLIARDAFSSVSGFDVEIPVFNDWDLFARLLGAGQHYAALPEPTVEWREHDGERITAASVKRANGIDLFIARHGNAMSGELRRSLKRTALGIRRRYAKKPSEQVVLAIRLAMAYTPGELARRMMERSNGPRP